MVITVEGFGIKNTFSSRIVEHQNFVKDYSFISVQLLAPFILTTSALFPSVFNMLLSTSVF